MNSVPGRRAQDSGFDDKGTCFPLTSSLSSHGRATTCSVGHSLPRKELLGVGFGISGFGSYLRGLGCRTTLNPKTLNP